ncbi:MAG: SET domain-containing protein [Verrucomicrobiota bacterium]
MDEFPVCDFAIEVRDSPIEGNGLFARVKLPKWTCAMEYKGTIVPWEEREEEAGEKTVLFEVDEDFVIDPRINGNEALYVNHSCDPNCETWQEEKRVYIFTRKKIKAGEELTIDYGLSLGRKPTKKDRKAYACHCATKNCRGTMLAF